MRVVDETCNEVKKGDIGAIVVKLPMPPGSLPTLWNADQRYIDSYLSEFPGHYKTADAGCFDEDGYVSIRSRTDDIINVAATGFHRRMEEVLSAHPDVAECAVVGVADQLKGQLPLGFIVLKVGADKADGDIVDEVVGMVARKDRPRRRLQTGDGGTAPAQDALGQNPARHHPEDR